VSVIFNYLSAYFPHVKQYITSQFLISLIENKNYIETFNSQAIVTFIRKKIINYKKRKINIYKRKVQNVIEHFVLLKYG